MIFELEVTYTKNKTGTYIIGADGRKSYRRSAGPSPATGRPINKKTKGAYVRINGIRGV
ncbi:hypothetical protein RHMOL_Rhmol06G0187100 [Rhododendron molle]|uniref:Uncharacterized protein n=1 Tax=Rhododendron molle TaxID=49168 RepID=A0ACC0NE24_RHOML|nr:hypothetical protein RHMOL_Rhmol06G0187100 [Rhododendron molle]